MRHITAVLVPRLKSLPVPSHSAAQRVCARLTSVHSPVLGSAFTSITSIAYSTVSHVSTMAPHSAQPSSSSAQADPRYGMLLQHMLQFHNGFRREIKAIQREFAAIKGKQLATDDEKGNTGHNIDKTLDRSTEELLARVVQLCHHLDLHHRIEEAHIFPVLAKKVPEFAEGQTHIDEHKKMHDALEAIEHFAMATMRTARASKTKGGTAACLDCEAFQRHLQQLEETLLPHLEAEEKSLRAENLTKHGLTLREVMQAMG